MVPAAHHDRDGIGPVPVKIEVAVVIAVEGTIWSLSAVPAVGETDAACGMSTTGTDEKMSTVADVCADEDVRADENLRTGEQRNNKFEVENLCDVWESSRSRGSIHVSEKRRSRLDERDRK